MKSRRHHNNKGLRQVKRGKTTDSLRRIAAKLRIPFEGATELKENLWDTETKPSN